MTLEAYLLADRQWPHHLRVAHAEMQLRQATHGGKDLNLIGLELGISDIDFWKAVLAANDKKLH